jgi:hypothetical protein
MYLSRLGVPSPRKWPAPISAGPYRQTRAPYVISSIPKGQQSSAQLTGCRRCRSKSFATSRPQQVSVGQTASDKAKYAPMGAVQRHTMRSQQEQEGCVIPIQDFLRDLQRMIAAAPIVLEHVDEPQADGDNPDGDGGADDEAAGDNT